MQQNEKRHLKIIKNNMTCFNAHKKHNVICQRKTCPQWISFKEGYNCTVLATVKGPYTLQKIGQIFDLTRMRICQIEKDIFDKIKRNIK